jgi:hypothetical protein
MDEVPIVGKAVFRRVLTHGRDTDPVGESDGTELKWRKKRMAHVGLNWSLALEFMEPCTNRWKNVARDAIARDVMRVGCSSRGFCHFLPLLCRCIGKSEIRGEFLITGN